MKPSLELLKRTIEVWQPLSKEKLTEEDAREIIENMTGLFSLLLELDQRDGKKEEKTQS
jgi:hypothetical protein